MTQSSRAGRPLALFAAVLLSGAAGLAWEVIWQHHATLALGASAFGAAITLASLMAGLGIGALAAQSLLRRGRIARPLVAYGKDRFERYHKGRRWGHRMAQANLAEVRAESIEPEPR
ncbi:MAG TPA: hypothetical protein VII72_09215 [Myxococcota bacterium]